MASKDVRNSFASTEASLGESFTNLATGFTIGGIKKAAEKLLKDTKQHGVEAAKQIERHVIQINQTVAELSAGELTKKQASRIIGRHKVNIRRWAERAQIAVSWELAEAYWSTVGNVVDLIGTVLEIGSLFI